jgi:hypothetical protein
MSHSFAPVLIHIFSPKYPQYYLLPCVMMFVFVFFVFVCADVQEIFQAWLSHRFSSPYEMRWIVSID